MIENYCFEKIEGCKYLGMEINIHNDYHEEIRLRVKAGNRAIFRCRKLSSLSYYKKIEIEIL